MTKEIAKLQYVTAQPNGEEIFSQIVEVCESGIEWLQLRVKERGHLQWLDLALRAKQICDEHNVTFIVNDNVTIAKAVNAHGVHLGKNDMSPSEARRLLGDKIIGGTANTFEDVEGLIKQGVDYIGLGPFRFTSTKKNLSPIIGIEGYKSIIGKCLDKGYDTPIIAIGGIEIDDITDLLQTSVYGIAVSGLITKSENKGSTIDQIKQKLQIRFE